MWEGEIINPGDVILLPAISTSGFPMEAFENDIPTYRTVPANSKKMTGGVAKIIPRGSPSGVRS